MLKKTILILIFLFLNTLTYGQKKIPVLQHISGYIITGTDTIKIQRYNSAEYHKLGTIVPNYSYTLQDAVFNIQVYLDARSRGEIPDNPNEIEMRFNNLTTIAKAHKVYFDLENYKKELAYYRTEEQKKEAKIKEQKEREEQLKRAENKKIADAFFAKIKADSLHYVELKQKTKNDSIEYENQKKINNLTEKERQKQEARKQIGIKQKQKKYDTEIQARRKLEYEKRRNQIINKYGLANGEAILNHKVKIGWTKSMCIASWGKPYDINRTTTTYGSHEQYVYSLKKYLYFENGILTAIQD
jgi:hypothetical protein